MIERYMCLLRLTFHVFTFNTVLQPTVGPIFTLIHWQRKTTMLLSWGLGWNHQSTYLHVLKANVTRLMRRKLGVYHSLPFGRVLKGLKLNFGTETMSIVLSSWDHGDHHKSSWFLMYPSKQNRFGFLLGIVHFIVLNKYFPLFLPFFGLENLSNLPNQVAIL